MDTFQTFVIALMLIGNIELALIITRLGKR
jgi:hypothetical protein